MAEHRSDRSGSTGLLGVIIGAVLVIALVFFLFAGFNDTDDVDVSLEEPAVEQQENEATGSIGTPAPAPSEEPAAPTQQPVTPSEQPAAPAEPSAPSGSDTGTTTNPQ